MLSERERRTLDEMEQQLLMEDPRFAASIDSSATPRPEERWIGVAALASVLLPVGVLLTRMPAALETLATVTIVLAGAVWLWWRGERHRPNGWREQP